MLFDGYNEKLNGYKTKINNKINKHPSLFLGSTAIFSGFAGAGISFYNGNSEDISDSLDNIYSGIVRAVSINSNEIISNASQTKDLMLHLYHSANILDEISESGLVAGCAISTKNLKDSWCDFSSYDKKNLFVGGGCLILATLVCGCTDNDTNIDNSNYVDDNEYNTIFNETEKEEIPEMTQEEKERQRSVDIMKERADSNPDLVYTTLKTDEHFISGVNIEGVTNYQSDGSIAVANEKGAIIFERIVSQDGNIMEIYNLDGEGDQDIVLINTEETGLIGFEYAGHNDIKAYLGYYNHPDLYEHVEDINVKPLDNSDIIKYKKLN